MGCKAVVFRNRGGARLFGIVHHPDSGRPNPVPVILLSPGVKSRVAPHRLYVKLARHLASVGFVVLRFDFAGLGDSEGVIGEAVTADFYGTVQTGRYVDDTRAAMDWMAAEYGASRFILAGLCGGAITGLLAGAQDRRVDSLVGLGLPVLLDSENVDPTKYLTAGELEQWREGYFAKVFDIRSWLRLVTFRSNYRVILKVLSGWLRRRTSSESVAPAASPAPADNFNPMVPRAFRAMAATRHVLLVFGEADRLHSIYQERFAQPFRSELSGFGDRVEVHVVENANHVFSLPEWEGEMRRHLDAWLRRRYLASEEARTAAEA